MERFLTILAWLFAELAYKAHKKNNPSHTLFYIRGTGKDYPKYFVYSQSESWTKELSDLCNY